MDLGLRGKVAIVTGAGRGIGKTIAQTFAQEGAIPIIAEKDPITGKATTKEMKALEVDSLFIHTDISSLDSIRQMAELTKEKFGQIDILVNNATIMAPAQFFMEESWEDINREIDVIYRGCLYCIRSVLDYMVPAKSGSIVSILTDAARVGEPRMANYGALKAGIGGLSRTLAKEMGRNNIRINCVSPSMTLTELAKGRRELEKQKLGEEKFKELQDKRLSFYSIRRFGNPQDIANMVVFLSSDRSSWVTGQTISVNGGYAIGPW